MKNTNKPGNVNHNLNRTDIGGNRFCSACGQVEIIGQKGQVFMLTPECPINDGKFVESCSEVK